MRHIPRGFEKCSIGMLIVDVPSYSECYKCMSLQMREMFRELGVLMERLWEDPAVQLAYSRSVQD